MPLRLSMRLFLVLVLLCLFACDSPREMESRSNAVPQKETVQKSPADSSQTESVHEQHSQASALPRKFDWKEEMERGYIGGMACGETFDGGRHCVPYQPDPELDSIVKMCKNDSPESCKIERRKKIKELVARRKAAKANAAQSSQP